MPRFDLLLFDLDGTLVDTSGDIAASANHVRVKAGHEPLEVDTVLGFVGDGARHLMEKCLHGTGLDPAAGTLAFERYYAAHPCDHSRVYAGIPELLDATRDLPRAVVTNKPLRHALLVLEGLALAGAFRLVLGGSSVPRRKPAADPLRFVMRQFGARPDRTLMIGDGPQDIVAGQAAGTRTAAAAWGFQPPDRLAALEPDSLFEDPFALAGWLDLLPS